MDGDSVMWYDVQQSDAIFGVEQSSFGETLGQFRKDVIDKLERGFELRLARACQEYRKLNEQTLRPTVDAIMLIGRASVERL